MDKEEKDLIIAQLQEENVELRKFEEAYNELNGKLTDLEYNFKMIQDEDEVESVNSNNENEDQRMEEDLAIKKDELEAIYHEVFDVDNELKEKDEEIKQLKIEYEKMKENVSQSYLSKNSLEVELDDIKREKLNEQKKFANLIAVKNKVSREYSKIQIAGKDLEKEKEILVRKVEKLESQLKEIKETKPKVIQKSNSFNKYIEQLIQDNQQYENDNIFLSNKINDINLKLEKANQVYNEKINILKEKEKELKRLIGNEKMNSSIYTKKEPESISRSERCDYIDINQKSEKVLSAKKELQKIKTAHGKLLENRKKINEELNALKKHRNIFSSLFCIYLLTINCLRTAICFV